MTRLILFFSSCFLFSCAQVSDPEKVKGSPRVVSEAEGEPLMEQENKLRVELKENQDSLEAVAHGYRFDVPTLYLKAYQNDVIYASNNYGGPNLKDTLSDNQGFTFRVSTVVPITGEGDEGLELIQISDSSDKLMSQLFYWSGTFGDSFRHEIMAELGDGDGLFLYESLVGAENATINEDGSISGKRFEENTEHEYHYDSTGVLFFSGSSKPDRVYVE